MKAILFLSGSLFVFALSPGAYAQSSTLPEGPSQKLVELVCSKCHSTDRIASKRLTKAEWKEEVTEMLQEEDDVTEAEKDEIIDYLAKNFPASKEFSNVQVRASAGVPAGLAAAVIRCAVAPLQDFGLNQDPRMAWNAAVIDDRKRGVIAPLACL